VVVAAVLVGLWALSGAHFFWPVIPLMFLLIGLMSHRRRTYYHYHYGHSQPVAPWNAPDYR